MNAFSFGVGIPFQRLTPMLFREKPALLLCAPDISADSSSPSFGIAVFTPRRDLRATPPRMKGEVSPYQCSHPGEPFPQPLHGLKVWCVHSSDEFFPMRINAYSISSCFPPCLHAPPSQRLAWVMPGDCRGIEIH